VLLIATDSKELKKGEVNQLINALIMSVKKDTIKTLLKSLKAGKKADDGKITAFTDAEIDALINDAEEKEVALPEGVKIFTPEEYTTLETNLKDAGKGGYTKAGKEIAIKEMKEKLGIEFDGKDIETFLTKAEEHFVAKAKIPANEAKQQWEKDKGILQTQITDWKTKYESEVGASAAAKLDATLLAKFPANRSKGLSDEDRLLLLKSKMEVKNEDSKQVVYYKGEKLQDNLTNPLNIDTAITHVFTAEKWLEEGKGGAGGRGGNNNNAGGGGNGVFKTLRDVNEHIEKNNWHPGSQQATQFMQQVMKDNPQLDLATV
jgi:ribosomal protein S20